jgi:hypothetical protein
MDKLTQNLPEGWKCSVFNNVPSNNFIAEHRRNQNTKYSFNRNWMKLMSSLNSVLQNLMTAAGEWS